MSTYDVCVIGCGVAGTIILLKLLESISPDKICVVDPAFDGGDLARNWSDIKSNTPWSLFLSSTEKLPVAKAAIDKRRDKYNPDDITPVWELSKSLSIALIPYLKEMDTNTCFAREAQYESTSGLWKITLDGCSLTRYAKKIVYAPGGIPKQVNLSKPQIPLEVALDNARLQRAIEPGQHILLFGLSHSGVLVVRNLLNLGVYVSVIYRTHTPFVFASDGAYQGIKAEAANVARELLATPNEHLTLIQSSDAPAVIRAFNRCDAIISAIGFVKNTNTCVFKVDGEIIDSAKYNSQTGKIDAASQLWGIGLAYPSTTTYDGKVYEDAGVASFINHAIEIVPGILGVDSHDNKT
jgi:hypothetical protein